MWVSQLEVGATLRRESAAQCRVVPPPKATKDTLDLSQAEEEPFSACNAPLNGEERKPDRTSVPFFLLWLCYETSSSQRT